MEHEHVFVAAMTGCLLHLAGQARRGGQRFDLRLSKGHGQKARRGALW